MKTIILPKNILFVVGTACLLVILSAIPSFAEAATCGFYRDLTVGTSGKDVRCLQQYLNQNYLRERGYVIDASGVYTGQTQQAVIWWQQSNGIYPASGFFGPHSRTRFQAMAGYTNQGTNQQPQYNVNNDSREALAKILSTLEAIRDAEDEIDDSNKSTTKAEKLLNDARQELINAIRAFFNRDYDEALDQAKDANENAEDAIDLVDGSSTGKKSDAKDAIDDVEDAIDNAWDDIKDADDDGDDVDEAEDILRDAEDTLEDARDAYDDRDYNDAEDLANDAEDLVEDALDAIDENYNNYDDVEDRLNDAWDDLDNAWDDVNDAWDDNDNVGDADEFLDDARDLLNDAEDALDDGDEDEADDLIDEAEELINDALDEF